MKPSAFKVFLLFVFLVCGRLAVAQDADTSLYDTRVKPQLISSQFGFTEGCSVDKHGNVFFTDQNNNKIWKYGTGGQLSLFMNNAGRSNGTIFDKKGNLIACADEKNQLWSINRKGKIKVLLAEFEGKRLNGPNDVWADKQGGIYFTDPYYQRPWWERKKPELDGQKVYYLPKNKKVPVIVIADLMQPNGIVGTPDGKYLYVADIRGRKTYRYTIAGKGRLEEKTLLMSQGSDGMTLDNRGNIYLTGRGVTVYNSSGTKIAQIDTPNGRSANVCFGGVKRDQLFITATESVYILPMKVRGVE
jgi:gluconolactonase